jgi:CRP/FNR family cyclic AMP-dependent transcriptional regulator
MTELTKGLRQVPFLDSLEDFQLQHLIRRGQRVALQAGQILFRRGDPGNCMYVILDGQVQIYLETKEGHAAVLRVLQAGEFFGEMALLDGGSRSANALAVSSSELFVLERAAFLDLLTTSPELLSRLFSGLTERLRATDERYLQEEIANQKLWAETERERYRSLAETVASVTQELYNPLGSIKTRAGVIKTELTSETMTALFSDPKVKMLVENLLETADAMQKNVTYADTLIQRLKHHQ